MVRPRSLPELLVLGLISAGFGGAILAYQTIYPDLFDNLTSDEVALGFLTCVGTFWVAVRLTESDNITNHWLRLGNALCIGTGINLIVQALLNYLDILTRSMFLIVIGGIFATTLLTIASSLLPSRAEAFQAHSVLVGFDCASEKLVGLLPYPVAAVVGDKATPVAPEVPYLEFEKTLSAFHPRQILVTADSSGWIDPSALLSQRLNGAYVNSTSELYEEMLGRVCCAGRAPVDLLLSKALSGNQEAMAFQAIYTNLLGLALLILTFPAILAAAALTLLIGSGPILEREECRGFRNIPFLRMRFRTKRADGSLHSAGRVIAWLRLTNLPLLLNVIRGEMALFGPCPVRREFADRLAEIVPFYSMRFAVKPGIVDWGDVQVNYTPVSAQPTTRPRRSVLTAIEYDLYYVKHASPLLDFEILMRLLFQGKRRESSSTELAAAAR
jgi:lipopolysaccharide/colanic/teichoic acid biosynthesis glycosyltransferase